MSSTLAQINQVVCMTIHTASYSKVITKGMVDKMLQQLIASA